MPIQYTTSPAEPVEPPVHGTIRVGNGGKGDLELLLNGVLVLSVGNVTGIVNLKSFSDAERRKLPSGIQTAAGKLKVC